MVLLASAAPTPMPFPCYPHDQLIQNGWPSQTKAIMRTVDFSLDSSKSGSSSCINLVFSHICSCFSPVTIQCPFPRKFKFGQKTIHPTQKGVDRRKERRRRRSKGGEEKMTRGRQKIEAQRKNAEKNQKQKGSQLEARAVALKVNCPICKVQLANQNQLVDHYSSKHPKEKPPSDSG